MLRCDLKKLVRIDIFNGLFQAHEPGRDQSERLIGTGRTRVGQMFGLAHIDIDVHGLSALTDDHSGIYILAGADKELASFLSTEESVRDGCAGLEGDQGSLLAVCDPLPLVSVRKSPL